MSSQPLIISNTSFKRPILVLNWNVQLQYWLWWHQDMSSDSWNDSKLKNTSKLLSSQNTFLADTNYFTIIFYRKFPENHWVSGSYSVKLKLEFEFDSEYRSRLEFLKYNYSIQNLSNLSGNKIYSQILDFSSKHLPPQNYLLCPQATSIIEKSIELIIFSFVCKCLEMRFIW